MEPVLDASLHSAPSLDQVRDNVERLVDYAMARGVLDDELIDAFSKLAKTSLFQALQARTQPAKNPEILRVACELCAQCIGPLAQDWVRQQSNEGPKSTIVMAAFIRAAPHCFPRDEAFERALGFFGRMRVGDHGEKVHLLGILQDPRVVDWIERRLANSSETIGGYRGDAVAGSGISWNPIRSWLARGRPLSLEALDTLSYLRKDSAPRIEQRVRLIQDRWARICHPGEK